MNAASDNLALATAALSRVAVLLDWPEPHLLECEALGAAGNRLLRVVIDNPNWSGAAVDTGRGTEHGAAMAGNDGGLSLMPEDLPGENAGPRLALAVRFERDPSTRRGRSVVAELAVIRAAALTGVRVPESFAAVEDNSVAGRAFMVMSCLSGVPHTSLSDGPADEASLRQVIVELARVHSVRRPFPGLEDLQEPTRDDGAGARIESMRSRLDKLPEPNPILEWVLRHLERRAPGNDGAVFCHGDARLSNTVFDGRTLLGLVDWEDACWGDPMSDLGTLSEDWMSATGRVIDGGLRQAIAPVLEAYAASGGDSGAVPDPDRLMYWIFVASAERRVAAWQDACIQQDGGDDVCELRVDALADLQPLFDALDPEGAARGLWPGETSAGEAPTAGHESLLRALSDLYGPQWLDDLDDDPAAHYREAVRRFARDIRDGWFDGACAMGVRGILRAHALTLMVCPAAAVAD